MGNQSVEFAEFEECLFRPAKDVEDELDDIAAEEGTEQVVGWLVKILSSWEARASGMTPKLQDRVLWRIGSYPLFLGWQLKPDSGLETDLKLEIVQAAKCVTLSIPALIPSTEAMETAYFMWWDLLASGEFEHPVGDLLIETYRDLVVHPDERVRIAALHGLGHLVHPGRESAVDLYLQFHPEDRAEERVQQCRAGTLM